MNPESDQIKTIDSLTDHRMLLMDLRTREGRFVNRLLIKTLTICSLKSLGGRTSRHGVLRCEKSSKSSKSSKSPQNHKKVIKLIKKSSKSHQSHLKVIWGFMLSDQSHLKVIWLLILSDQKVIKVI